MPGFVAQKLSKSKTYCLGCTLETAPVFNANSHGYVENFMKNKSDDAMGGLGAQIMMASELGSAIVVLTVAGYFAGAWLDGRFQSSPYGVIVGISVGFGLGIAFVIKRSNDMDKKS
ncbi:AtpZ/AtpI family protein [bacterium]|jgi:F0F1-type ATP synthase assembly protein I|nr:AtpZ/AtpI family protein [bacterium]